MGRLFQPLLFALAQSSASELQKQIEFLRAENGMLRKRVPKKRVFLKEDERARLLKLGKDLGPRLRHVITIVDYSTFRRWVRKEEGTEAKPCKGRPRITRVIREVVLEIAKENNWGYSRILGELRKLGIGKISRQSVKNILVENGLDPGPKRSEGSWSEFLKMHAETLWQVDFFSKRIWTAKGPKQVFAMAFIHVGSRRVFVTPSTCQPHAAWMKTQAAAILAYAEREQLGCSMILRDYDGKYVRDFDRAFTDRGITMKLVGPRAPNLNAFVERWIQSLKHEALDHFFVFGLEHFDVIVREYLTYYHECRPHQGMENKLLSAKQTEEPPAIVSLDELRCQKRLGGLLKHYYRAA